MAIDFSDITYSVQMGVLWTVLEPELAIICANMPVLKPVLSRIFPRLFSTSSRRTYGVSDPQAFERLDEQHGNIYPLNQVGRDPLKTDITAGHSRSRSKGRFTTATVRSMDEESAESDEQRLRDNAQAVDGINVTKNFDVKYHR